MCSISVLSAYSVVIPLSRLSRLKIGQSPGLTKCYVPFMELLSGPVEGVTGNTPGFAGGHLTASSSQAAVQYYARGDNGRGLGFQNCWA
jgi:hypothetical protein